MQTIEFMTSSQGDKIDIPLEFRHLANGTFRVIILKEDDAPNSNVTRLLQVLDKYKNVKPFKNIDPVEWQRNLRNTDDYKGIETLDVVNPFLILN